MSEPITEDWLEEWSRNRQLAAFGRDPKCAHCGHSEHGLICRSLGRTSCDCPSSFREAA